MESYTIGCTPFTSLLFTPAFLPSAFLPSAFRIHVNPKKECCFECKPKMKPDIVHGSRARGSLIGITSAVCRTIVGTENMPRDCRVICYVRELPIIIFKYPIHLLELVLDWAMLYIFGLAYQFKLQIISNQKVWSIKIICQIIRNLPEQ